MKDGLCPKCRSDEIYTRPGFANQIFSDVKNLQAYVCADCGYMEIYAPDKDDRVSVLWNRVRVPRQKPKNEAQE